MIFPYGCFKSVKIGGELENTSTFNLPRGHQNEEGRSGALHKE